MKNYLKIHLSSLLLLLVVILGQLGCCYRQNPAPPHSAVVDSFYVGTSIGAIDHEKKGSSLEDSVQFSFFQTNPPFIDSITLDLQTAPKCISKILGVLANLFTNVQTTCNGKEVDLGWTLNSQIFPDSTCVRLSIGTSSTISCTQNFAFDGSLVVVLSEVDPKCSGPKIWCRKATFTDTNGDSQSFNFVFNHQ